MGDLKHVPSSTIASGKPNASCLGQQSNRLHPANATQIPANLHQIKKTLSRGRKKLLTAAASLGTAQHCHVLGPGAACSN